LRSRAFGLPAAPAGAGLAPGWVIGSSSAM
jgi:hypothetical protein